MRKPSTKRSMAMAEEPRGTDQGSAAAKAETTRILPCSQSFQHPKLPINPYVLCEPRGLGFRMVEGLGPLGF